MTTEAWPDSSTLDGARLTTLSLVSAVLSRLLVWDWVLPTPTPELVSFLRVLHVPRFEAQENNNQLGSERFD